MEYRQNDQVIRRKYAPLVVSVSLTCLTDANAPLLQAFDPETNEFVPNREAASFTLVKPVVTAYANDGSLKSPYFNSALAMMKWFLDGVDMATLDGTGGKEDWRGKYEILTTGDERGTLKIMKNVPAGIVHYLHFEGVIADSRTGKNVPVVSDPIPMRTVTQATEKYVLSIGDTHTIEYDPFADPLDLRQYQIAHGEVPTVTAAEASASKDNYLRSVPFIITNGGGVYSGNDVVIDLYRVDAAGNVATTPLTVGQNEIIELDRNHVLLDLRLITKNDYMAVASKVTTAGKKEVDRLQFGAFRLEPQFDQPIYANKEDIPPTATQRYNLLLVNYNGNVLRCPERVIKIVWKTDSAYKTNVIHTEGRSTTMNLAETGIGENHDYCWLKERVTTEHKPAHAIAADSSGEIWGDSNGVPYIFH